MTESDVLRDLLTTTHGPVDNFSLGECPNTTNSCNCQYSYQYYTTFDRIAMGLLALPIMTFGICANLTSFRIFTHRLMSSSSINWYLAVLSISDTMILISSFFVLTLPRLGEFLLIWSASSFSYHIAPLFFGLMTLGQTLSVYMTVGVSIHRYIGVCHPYKANQILPKGNVIAFITSLIVFSILFNFSRFFEVQVSMVCYRINIDHYMPHLEMTDLRKSAAYLLIFHGWVNTIIMFVLPFTILIGFNWKVFCAVRRSRRMHSVAVVILFICCNSLSFVCNILENIEYDIHHQDFYAFLCTINNMTVIVNASVNICIYMLFSEKYRLLLRYYLCCDWSRQGEMLLNSVMT